jgi:hypothetical protein
MANTKKPRKAYKPKGIPGALPVVFGIDPAARTELGLQPYLCIEAFKAGAGTEQHAYSLVSAINIGAVLAEDHPENQAAMLGGLDAIRSVVARGSAGRWGLSGDELNAISNAIARGDEMQQASTRRVLREAVHRVYREAA